MEAPTPSVATVCAAGSEIVGMPRSLRRPRQPLLRVAQKVPTSCSAIAVRNADLLVLAHH
jgi:hypothetical protein